MRRLYLDLDLGYFVSSPGTADRVDALGAKRGDNEQVVVQFCRGLEIQELASGATGKLGGKPLTQYDVDYVIAAPSWTKAGSGTSTTYTFELSLSTAELDELLGVGAEADEESVVLNFEMEWVADGYTTSSNTIALTVRNDVVRGTELGPTEPGDGVPVQTTYARWENVLDGGAMSAGETFTIGSNVYTARTSGIDTAGEFSMVGFASTVLGHLRDEINGDGIGEAHPDVVASVEGGTTLVLTAREPGTAGNGITVASSDENWWDNAHDDELAGGVDGTQGYAHQMLVYGDYLYLVKEVDENGVATWGQIPIEALS